MHIEGGCHCGKLAYEAEVNPADVRICHCTDCQVFSGSAFRITIPTPKDAFKLISGQPKFYIKTAQSGNKRAQAFCADCGTHIYATSATDPQVIGIRAGTARQRAELHPQLQIWCQSAQAWVMDLKSIGQIAGQS